MLIYRRLKMTTREQWLHRYPRLEALPGCLPSPRQNADERGRRLGIKGSSGPRARKRHLVVNPDPPDHSDSRPLFTHMFTPFLCLIISLHFIHLFRALLTTLKVKVLCIVLYTVLLALHSTD
jgi:hypothetical protein